MSVTLDLLPGFSASHTCLDAKSFETSFVAFRRAMNLLAVDGDGKFEERPNQIRIPNTSKVGTRPFGPTESLTAFTDVCKTDSLSYSMLPFACCCKHTVLKIDSGL